MNTPRAIYDANQQLRWKWEQQEPFGVNVPDENPSALGVVEMPLRFPGQYFDKETNLHYNYFRDFDPALGRYEESDPIGLRGGLNTYAYVGADPLRFIDPEGLVDEYPSCNGDIRCINAMKAAGIPPVTQSQSGLKFNFSANIPVVPVRIGYFSVPLGFSLSCTIGPNWATTGYIGAGVIAGTSIGGRPVRAGATSGTTPSPQGVQTGFRANVTYPNLAVPGTTTSLSTFCPVGPSAGSCNDPQGTLQFGGGLSTSATYGVQWGPP